MKVNLTSKKELHSTPEYRAVISATLLLVRVLDAKIKAGSPHPKKAALWVAERECAQEVLNELHAAGRSEIDVAHIQDALHYCLDGVAKAATKEGVGEDYAVSLVDSYCRGAVNAACHTTAPTNAIPAGYA